MLVRGVFCILAVLAAHCASEPVWAEECDSIDDIIPLKIRSDYYHSCVVLNKGKIKCWGANDVGQLGTGTTEPHGNTPFSMGSNLPPTDLGTNVQVSDVCLGSKSNCALTTDGKVKCWGNNTSGQLGLGTADTSVGRLASEMGDNLPFVNLGQNFVAKKIKCSSTFVCALNDDGKIKCWGSSNNGELGADLNNRPNLGRAPGDMGEHLPFLPLPIKAKYLTVGSLHGCAASDRDIYCWGNNTRGQIGIESQAQKILLTADPQAAIKVKLEDSDVDLALEDISAGSYETCALYRPIINGVKQDKKIKCWGYNSYGNLGIGSSASIIGRDQNTMGSKLPSVALDLNNVVQIESHEQFNCARTSKGEVKCWGMNSFGMLGLGDARHRGAVASDMGSSLPKADLGLPAIHISSGATSSSACAILVNHEIKCWGAGFYGTLGYEDVKSRGFAPNEMGENLPYVHYK